MVGSFEAFASRSGVLNWEAFVVPMAILFAVQGGSAGLNMVSDIESGYFDKLLVTPANRFAILIGAMSADFLRVMAQAGVVLLLAVAFGLDFATGWLGAATLIVLSGFWGLAYSGIGFAVALRTGSAQATQSVSYLILPFMFLTTMFAPKEDLSGWLSTASTFNPMTYLLQGMRVTHAGGLERLRSRRRGAGRRSRRQRHADPRLHGSGQPRSDDLQRARIPGGGRSVNATAMGLRESTTADQAETRAIKQNVEQRHRVRCSTYHRFSPNARAFAGSGCWTCLFRLGFREDRMGGYLVGRHSGRSLHAPAEIEEADQRGRLVDPLLVPASLSQRVDIDVIHHRRSCG